MRVQMIAAAGALVCAATFAQAATFTGEYRFTGTGTPSGAPVDTDLGNATLTSFSIGAGISRTSANNVFNTTNYTRNGTQGGAVATDDYVEFSLVADTGYIFDLTSFSFGSRSSLSDAETTQGPNSYVVKYSTDAISPTQTFTDLATGSHKVSKGTDSSTRTETIVSSVSAALSDLTTITLRVYSWGATATSGTQSSGSLRFDDVIVAGQIAPVPEAGTALMVGGLVAAAGAIRRRSVDGASAAALLRGLFVR